MRQYHLNEATLLTVAQGDLTTLDVDAIVNAANEAMLGGGGVDGAIHRAAGPDLLSACYEVPPVRPFVRCPTGDARITPGFRLPARFVIHTVGPVWGTPDAEILLGCAYESSLALARAHHLKTVAFPAISCGAYGCPLEVGADIAIRACREHGAGFDEILFVLFAPESYAAFVSAAERLCGAALEG